MKRDFLNTHEDINPLATSDGINKSRLFVTIYSSLQGITQELFVSSLKKFTKPNPILLFILFTNELYKYSIELFSKISDVSIYERTYLEKYPNIKEYCNDIIYYKEPITYNVLKIIHKSKIFFVNFYDY